MDVTGEFREKLFMSLVSFKAVSVDYLTQFETVVVDVTCRFEAVVVDVTFEFAQ